MCVIIYKPKGQTISKNVIRECWINNPDGVGYMYSDGKRLYVVKGLMSLASVFADKVHKLDHEAAIHFRYATHGKTGPLMTHPFGVSADKYKLETGEGAVALVMHNGILPSFGSDYLSDTADFARSVLSKIRGHADRVKLLGSMPGKYCYASADALEFSLIGHFVDHQGCKFSNTYWRDQLYYTGKSDKFSKGWKLGSDHENTTSQTAWRNDWHYSDDGTPEKITWSDYYESAINKDKQN